MNFINKLTHWYFSNKALPYWGILLLDCLIVFASALWVYAFDNGTVYAIHHWRPLCLMALVYAACYIVGFRLFHTYSGVVRYSSFIDLLRVGEATSIGFALTACLDILLPWSWLQETFTISGLLLIFFILYRLL